MANPPASRSSDLQAVWAHGRGDRDRGRKGRLIKLRGSDLDPAKLAIELRGLNRCRTLIYWPIKINIQ